MINRAAGRTRPLRVAVADLQAHPSGTVALPYLWGTLRSYAEQFEEIRRQVVFLPPIWRMAPSEALLGEIDEPDILAVSAYIWNERNGLRLARAVKARYPSCRVVFGGPNVPAGSTAFLDAHGDVDLCVHGEGEPAFAGILRESLKAVPNWSAIAGISYRDGATSYVTAPERMSVLDFPSPYTSGLIDDSLAALQAQGRETVAFLETNRGCPYSCAFCDWGMATMSKTRLFSEERVLGELEWISRHRVNKIVLCDANFGMFTRDLDFTRRLVSLKAQTGFPGHVHVTGFAKNNRERPAEITELLQEHGLLGSDRQRVVSFSLQSMSQRALEAVNRRNIPLSGYEQAAVRYRASGFKISTELILPLPGETAEAFKAGFAELASRDHAAHIVVYPCFILPNAPMAQPAYRERWGLVTETELAPAAGAGLERELVEGVVATADMTSDELADCKVFVAVIEALELHGVLRYIRQYLSRTINVSAQSFYADFIRWQTDQSGCLAKTFSETWAYSRAKPLSPISSGQDAGYHPHLQIFKTVRSSKIVMFDALKDPNRFADEIRAFLRDRYGWVLDEEQQDLIRFQTRAWITPLDNPLSTPDAEFLYDWPAYFRGAQTTPDRRLTRVTYPIMTDWIEAGYRRPSQVHWLLFALAPRDGRTMRCLREYTPVSERD